MSFKIKSPYNIDNTPIYFVDEKDGVLGRTNMNCTITINNKVRDPKQIKEIIKHEMVHVKQIKDGRLAYDNNNIYHRKSGKGKWSTVKRNKKVDGSPLSWWEKEAYNKK
jgi:tRNA-dihydrouridine synthase